MQTKPMIAERIFDLLDDLNVEPAIEIRKMHLLEQQDVHYEEMTDTTNQESWISQMESAPKMQEKDGLLR